MAMMAAPVFAPGVTGTGGFHSVYSFSNRQGGVQVSGTRSGGATNLDEWDDATATRNSEFVSAAGAAWGANGWAASGVRGGALVEEREGGGGGARRGLSVRVAREERGGGRGGRVEPPSVAVTGATASILAARLDAAGAGEASGAGAAPPTSASAPPRRGAKPDAAAQATGATYRIPQVRTYGQLFEALLRGWSCLPVGLYRRLAPGVSPSPPIITDPVAQYVSSFSRTANGADGAPLFRNEKGLVSYVFTNPPQDTVLNYLDYVYLVRPDGEDD